MSSSRMTLARNPRQGPRSQLEQGSDLNECVVLSSHMGSRACFPPITARGVEPAPRTPA